MVSIRSDVLYLLADQIDTISRLLTISFDGAKWQMVEHSRIAVINTGWSEDYAGGQVTGAFGYLATGVGHEQFNFKPTADGRYFAYAPPLGEGHNPPKPVHASEWLVFFVSKRPGRSGLYLVGWYERAEFAGSYEERPDANLLGADSDGGTFSYTVSAPEAYLVPLPLRNAKIKGDHLKRSYAYLRGNLEKESDQHSENWRNDLAVKLLQFREFFKPQIIAQSTENPNTNVTPPQNSDRQKLVEKNAIAAVMGHFAGLHCESKEHLNTGYDLLFRDHSTGEEIHVEVKGTSLDVPNFYISRNEYEYAEKLAPNDRRKRRNADNSWRPLWRLAVVSNALGNAKVNLYTYSDVNRHFDISPIAWRGVFKK